MEAFPSSRSALPLGPGPERVLGNSRTQIHQWHAEPQRRLDTFGTERPDERYILAPTSRSPSIGPLSVGSSAVERRKRDISGAFVHEKQPPRVEQPYPL